MSDLTTLCKSLKPVDSRDELLANWWPFYEGFALTRTCPRFFQAPTYLIPGKSAYGWGEVDGCLLVLKRRAYMGTYSLFALLPPMSKDGNLQVERQLIDRLRSLGISIRISDEDVDLFGIDRTTLTADSWREEYVYRSGDMIERKGKHWAHVRNKIHVAERLKAEGKLDWEIIVGKPKLNPVLSKVKPALEKWVGRATGWTGQLAQTVTSLQHAVEPCLTVLLYGEGGTVAGFSFSEGVGPGRVCLTTRWRAYDEDTHHDPTPVLQWLDLTAWNDTFGPDCMLNYGAAGIARSMCLAKERLHPARTNGIWRWDPAVKVDLKSIWQETKFGG
jgi:hypothetical protein